ncbi:hypothetical protein C2W62_46380 [Candidatus Entotheonella serta]|nr:hypothetical protein C2W62_46380 [Candidatus Entotheonella serta]
MQEASALAEELGDAHRLGRSISSQAQVLWLAADLEKALSTIQRAVSVVTPLEDKALLQRANHILANILFSQGEFMRAAETFRHILESYDNDSDSVDNTTPFHSVVEHHRCLSNAYAEMGLYSAKG